MGFAAFIAQRYLRTQRSRFVSVITIIAIVGITLGVMVLDTTLAVMNGFQDQIRFTFVENMPMVTVMTQAPSGFSDVEKIVDRVKEFPPVVGAAPYIRKEALLTFERFGGRTRDRPCVIWGIDPNRQKSVTKTLDTVTPAFTDFSTEGFTGVDPGTPGIVLGDMLARSLRVGVGDRLTLTTVRKTGGSRQYEGHSVEVAVVGIFTSGMYQFDDVFAYMDINAVRKIFVVIGGADGVGVKVDRMMRAPAYADSLAERLGLPYFTNDWISLNSALFRWIRIEKVLMFVLLSLITLVASFMVVAILLMMVRDRQHDIGIFLSLGVRKDQLVGVFVQLGMIIGGGGVVLGTILGYLLCRFLDSQGLWTLVERMGLPSPADVYFVDKLPVHMEAGDFLLVGGVTLLMCLLATLLPSWFATRFTPVEVLRYE
ncbi:MAG TPA: ABC transporter permease [Candidatus Krumholzibacteria bacterium]|nr:ABC transporter permease [Candidatus Krumholzibacteria bacterium]